MTAANTQATTDQAFRGINNAYLGVVKLDKDGKAVSTATTPIEKVHSFGTILDAKKLSQSEDDDLPESRRVIQLSLPTEVNTLMFWGKAIKDGTDRDQGKITMKVSDDLSQTSFSMCRIVPETAEARAPHIYQAALLQHQKVMAACLTQIIRSSIPEQSVTFGGESRTIPTLAWSDFVKVEGEAGNYTMKVSNISPVKDGAGNDQAMSALGEKLSMAFVTLNTIHANELRAGAGDAVAYMMKDLMICSGFFVRVPMSRNSVGHIRKELTSEWMPLRSGYENSRNARQCEDTCANLIGSLTLVFPYPNFDT